MAFATAITSSGARKVFPTSVGIKYSIGPSLLTFFLSMCQNEMCSTFSFCCSPMDNKTDSFSPSYRNVGNFNWHNFFWGSKGFSDFCGDEVFNWAISSDLLPINVPK